MSDSHTSEDEFSRIVQDGAALITGGQVIGHVSGIVSRKDVVTDFFVTPVDGRKEWLIPAASCDLTASGPDRLILSSAPDGDGGDEGKTMRIPLAEERLVATIREVDRGSVRIQRRVETEPVSTTIDLAQDDVEIDYRDINEPAEMVTLPHYEGETLVVPVYEEVPVITRQLMLRQEIRVTRRTTTHTVQVEDTIQRDVVDVERIEPKASSLE